MVWWKEQQNGESGDQRVSPKLGKLLSHIGPRASSYSTQEMRAVVLSWEGSALRGHRRRKEQMCHFMSFGISNRVPHTSPGFKVVKILK